MDEFIEIDSYDRSRAGYIRMRSVSTLRQEILTYLSDDHPRFPIEIYEHLVSQQMGISREGLKQILSSMQEEELIETPGWQCHCGCNMTTELVVLALGVCEIPL